MAWRRLQNRPLSRRYKHTITVLLIVFQGFYHYFHSDCMPVYLDAGFRICSSSLCNSLVISKLSIWHTRVYYMLCMIVCWCLLLISTMSINCLIRFMDQHKVRPLQLQWHPRGRSDCNICGCLVLIAEGNMNILA